MSTDMHACVDLQALSKGVLSSGLQFIVYQFLVNCDYFNPRSRLFPKGSVAGCYLLSLGLPTSGHKTASKDSYSFNCMA